MLRNYLTIAYRNLLKNKVFSLINILGLAIGMAACLLILQYVRFELSYDNFHQNAENIYRLAYSYQDDDNSYQSAVNVPAVGPALRQDFPEVASVARLYPFARYQFACAMQYDDVDPAVVFNEPNLYYADSTFLSLFSFPLLRGNSDTALRQAYSAVIAESTARKYFGDSNPIGKTLTLHSSAEQADFTVTGVMKDVPRNSHFVIDILLSFTSLRAEEMVNNWKDDIVYTYLQLPSQARPEDTEAKFSAFLAEHIDQTEAVVSMDLQPLPDIYLHSKLAEEMKLGGNASAIYLLTAVAIVILLIAWINYINLTTSRSMERAKEVGIRKVSGANRSQLIKQFLTESLLINSAGILVACTLVQLAGPFFYQIAGMPLPDNLWEANRSVLVGWPVLAFFAIGIFISGLYPAVFLSSFRPVTVLKGRLSGNRKGVLFRKGLVTFQFAVSIGLITGVFALYQQYHFMQNQDIGVDIDKTLVIKAPVNTDSLYVNRLTGFKAKLQQFAWVDRVATSSEVPGKVVNWTYDVQRNNNASAKSLAVQVIDTDFLETYGLQLLAGRNFFPSEQPESRFGDKIETVILNEEAVRQLGYASPEEAIGSTIDANGITCTIVGVVNNFHQNSLKSPLQPFIFLVNNRDSIYYSIKLSTTADQPSTQTRDQNDQLAIIQAEWNTFFPDNPFDYFYLTDFYQQQYRADSQLGTLFTIFSGLALSIASLGLFGLSSYTVVQRTKEIGIRKVLGASVQHVVALLSRDFILLVFIASLLILPVAFWAITQWLEHYAFRIEVTGRLLLLPIVIVLLIALLTVSVQTIKAALANPVDALRYE